MTKRKVTMADSRRKGKCGELELAKKLRELFPWCDAHRRQQYSGTAGDDDVAFMVGVHVECKRVRKKLNLWEAMHQAERDAKNDALPVVAHRRDNSPWLLTLRLDDLPMLVALIEERDNEWPEQESKP